MGTSIYALFRPISPLVESLHTLTVLLNIPLVLFLVIFSMFRRAGGVNWSGADIAGPGLLLLVFVALVTVIGGVISYLIAEIEYIHQMKRNRPS